MQMVRRSDDDGVHVFVVEKSAIVAAGWNVPAPGLFGSLMASFVEVGRAYAYTGGNLASGSQQVAPPNACTDDSKANLAILVGLSSERRRLQQRCLHGRARRHRACADADEIPPRN